MNIKKMIIEEVAAQLKEVMSRPGGKDFRRGPYGGATVDTMADKGVRQHQAMAGEIGMKLEFIKTIRDSFNPNSSEYRTAQGILDNCLDRMSPPNAKQLALLSDLYAKKKHEGITLKAKFPKTLKKESHWDIKGSGKIDDIQFDNWPNKGDSVGVDVEFDYRNSGVDQTYDSPGEDDIEIAYTKITSYLEDGGTEDLLPILDKMEKTGQKDVATRFYKIVDDVAEQWIIDKAASDDYKDDDDSSKWESSKSMKEEFDRWTCMECHYVSPKRFSRCPKCGSGEVENLG